MYAPTRHYGYDNMKGILVFLVVFGHFLELCPATLQKNILYLVIYSFHMPAFLFFSGFFAKYHPRRMGQLAILYGIFQLLYRLFAHFALQSGSALEPGGLLFTPYWLLWYIPVLLNCQLLLPLWTRRGPRQKIGLLALSICIALLCGYCKQIGYALSLSRFLVFLPFFLLGNLAGTHRTQIACSNGKFLLFLAVLVSISSLYLCRSGQFTPQMLYGSYSYAIGYHPGIRLQAMGIATAWIVFLAALSNTILVRPAPILSYIGSHTLPIYLLHGFVVKCIGKYSPSITIPTALLYSAISVALFGNPITSRLFYRLLPCKK